MRGLRNDQRRCKFASANRNRQIMHLIKNALDQKFNYIGIVVVQFCHVFFFSSDDAPGISHNIAVKC